MQQNLCEESKRIIRGLTDHWTLGALRLREFRYLFVESDDRVKLLNVITGGAFLHDVQRIFWDDLTLCVTRLTDGVGKGKNKNLTVQLLKDLPEVQSNQALRSEMEGKVSAAIRSAKPCIKYRHKRIGHIDLKSEIATSPKPVKHASMIEIKAALDEIHGCLSAVHRKLLDVELANVPPIGRGRSKVFALNSKELAEAIQFVDSLIDPSGKLDFKDQGAAVDFLTRLNRPVTSENSLKIVGLRELALLFKSKDE